MCLAFQSAVAVSAERAGPEGWVRFEFPADTEFKVYDGDTFGADLNKDGAIKKDEKVRLLYINTPEIDTDLSETLRKSQKPDIAMEATEFLRNQLKQKPVVIWSDPKNPLGKYKRRLAITMVGGKNLNIEVLRKGYSHFETRYSLPPDTLAPYTTAEAEAFDQQLGIWNNEETRLQLLFDLAVEEGRTVMSKHNPLLIPQPLRAARTDLADYASRFITLEGNVEKTESKSFSESLIYLETKQRYPVRALLNTDHNRLPQLTLLNAGDQIRVNGIVKWIENGPHLYVHYGEVLSRSE